MKKKVISFLLFISFLIVYIVNFNTYADDEEKLNITAKSAILMEASTGKIIYEKNVHESLRPASVTKIMTLLLLYDAIDSGKISWEEEVVVSEHAASMGGSQVYLEANEIQTVEAMTRCIAIASGNDAAVAMAEFIAGSEDGFVKMMNARAKELGMENTNFLNASGLDEDGHLTSAYDIAIMSRELITKYPEVLELTSIWMDTIIHSTKRGDEEFGLSNTNKLLKWYEGANGLKTGSTSKAKYCLSGTAKRNGLQLIAVVMAAPDYKTRFQEVMRLFDYGFANCKLYEDKIGQQVQYSIGVKKGTKRVLDLIAKEDFRCILDANTYNDSEITKNIIANEFANAPILKGDKLGEVVYSLGDLELGKADLIAIEDVPKATFRFYIDFVFKKFFR